MQNDKDKECANPCKRCQETGECAKVGIAANRTRLTHAQVLELAKRLTALKTNLGVLQHGGIPNASPQRETELQNEITNIQKQLLPNEHQND